MSDNTTTPPMSPSKIEKVNTYSQVGCVCGPWWGRKTPPRAAQSLVLVLAVPVHRVAAVSRRT